MRLVKTAPLNSVRSTRRIDNACEDTSITQAATRCSTISRRRACTAGASGVVCSASDSDAPMR